MLVAVLVVLIMEEQQAQEAQVVVVMQELGQDKMMELLELQILVLVAEEHLIQINMAEMAVQV